MRSDAHVAVRIDTHPFDIGDSEIQRYGIERTQERALHRRREYGISADIVNADSQRHVVGRKSSVRRIAAMELEEFVSVEQAFFSTVGRNVELGCRIGRSDSNASGSGNGHPPYVRSAVKNAKSVGIGADGHLAASRPDPFEHELGGRIRSRDVKSLRRIRSSYSHFSST